MQQNKLVTVTCARDITLDTCTRDRRCIRTLRTMIVERKYRKSNHCPPSFLVSPAPHNIFVVLILFSVRSSQRNSDMVLTSADQNEWNRMLLNIFGTAASASSILCQLVGLWVDPLVFNLVFCTRVGYSAVHLKCYGWKPRSDFISDFVHILTYVDIICGDHGSPSMLHFYCSVAKWISHFQSSDLYFDLAAR